MKKKPPRLSRKLREASPKPRARSGYGIWLTDLKQRIRAAQIRAALSVNRELIQLYWEIGRDIVLKQEKEGWGTTVIDRLSSDLQREFPEMSGFSRTNVYRMRAFYQAHSPIHPIVPQAVGQLKNAHPLSQIRNRHPPILESNQSSSLYRDLEGGQTRSNHLSHSPWDK